MNDNGIDFSKQKLPPIYKRRGRECYLDPIREKLIYITPEETVRQQVISYLLTELKVPAKMIDVEVHLSHYGVKSKRRVDILVNKYVEAENALVPLCVIETKAPNIMLGENAKNQMVDYCDALFCNYAMLTNGADIQCYHYDDEKSTYERIEKLPEYLDQIKEQYVELPEVELPQRFEIDELEANWNAYVNSDMGDNLTKKLGIPLVNLWECLIYPEHRLPKKKYKMFKLIEDMGIRLLSYGNAAGGLFQGAYRSFMIEYKGDTEIVSLGFSTYISNAKPDIIKTSLNVAIDNDKDTHHSLQLVLDDNATVVGNSLTLYHHGRIGISNKGSGKIDELRQFVEHTYPDIIDGKRFNLGSLVMDRLWNLDDEDVMKVVENLISYALIRDEYRDYVKQNKK